MQELMQETAQELAGGRVTFSKTGVVFAPDTPFEVWEAVAAEMMALEQSHRWWLGDLLNFGERAYGEKYSQVMEDTGLSYDTLQNYCYVAANVTMSARTDNLSWTHHLFVAHLPTVEQRRWLRKAIENKWSTRELREAIKAAQGPERATDGPQEPEQPQDTAEPETEPTAPVVDVLAQAATQTLGRYADVATWAQFREVIEAGADSVYVDLSDRVEQVGALQGLARQYAEGNLEAAIVFVDVALHDASVWDAIETASPAICVTQTGTAVYMGEDDAKFEAAFGKFGPVFVAYRA